MLWSTELVAKNMTPWPFENDPENPLAHWAKNTDYRIRNFHTVTGSTNGSAEDQQIPHPHRPRNRISESGSGWERATFHGIAALKQH
jgi:hypothetical protein